MACSSSTSGSSSAFISEGTPVNFMLSPNPLTHATTKYFQHETIGDLFTQLVLRGDLRPKSTSAKGFFFIKDKSGNPCTPSMKVGDYLAHNNHKFILIGFNDEKKGFNRKHLNELPEQKKYYNITQSVISLFNKDTIKLWSMRQPIMRINSAPDLTKINK